MNYLASVSVFEKQIRIGETIIPAGFIFLAVLFMAGIMIFNIIYLRQYRKMMSYLRNHHLDLYEQVRRKPDVGIFYSKAHNSAKPLVELARSAREMYDRQLSKVLSDFTKFSRRLTALSLIFIVVFMLFSAALILSLSN
ncbi:MAG: hypothetical protein ACFB0G_09245 [Leptolyngbyaceae cyanobacterium]|mgnify:FL=1